MKMMLALILAIALCAGGAAQSTDCDNVILSLSPCLSYISSNTSDQTDACCTQLDTMVSSELQCLCQMVNGEASNLGLNQDQALALHSACGVQTTPLSECNTTPASGSSPSRSGSDANSVYSVATVLSLLINGIYGTIYCT